MKTLLGVLLLCGVVWAGDDSVHNGNWWRSLPHDMRVAYVIGYNDGGCDQEMVVLSAINPLTEAQHQRVPSCAFPPETTYGQVTDSLDQFYQDASNRLIWVSDAVGCVKSEIEGHPLAKADILRMRRVDSNLSPALPSK